MRAVKAYMYTVCTPRDALFAFAVLHQVAFMWEGEVRMGNNGLYSLNTALHFTIHCVFYYNSV